MIFYSELLACLFMSPAAWLRFSGILVYCVIGGRNEKKRKFWKDRKFMFFELDKGTAGDCSLRDILYGLKIKTLPYSCMRVVQL